MFLMVVCVVSALQIDIVQAEIHHAVKVTNSCKLPVKVWVYKHSAHKANQFNCEMSIPPGESKICDMGISCLGSITGQFIVTKKLFDEYKNIILRDYIYPMQQYNPPSAFGCRSYNVTINDYGENTCILVQ